ncbi:MAG: hypothetical protein OEY14_13540 [Myxococcales bacterium]|nr:hypothetical protein [Myxococcales bacterium]
MNSPPRRLRRFLPWLALLGLVHAAIGCSWINDVPDVEPEVGSCTDGVDNDHDSEVDCADSDCREFCPTGSGIILPGAGACPSDWVARRAPQLPLAAFPEGTYPRYCRVLIPDPSEPPGCDLFLLRGGASSFCELPPLACDAAPPIPEEPIVDLLVGESLELRLLEIAPADPSAGRIWLRLPAGLYEASLTLPAGVGLLGPCDGEAVIAGSITLSENSALDNLVVRSLGLAASEAAIVLSERASASLHAIRVEIDAGRGIDVRAHATLVAEIVALDAVGAEVGLHIAEGAVAELMMTSVLGADSGVVVLGGQLQAQAFVARGGRRGIVVGAAATADLAWILLAEQTGEALVINPGDEPDRRSASLPCTFGTREEDRLGLGDVCATGLHIERPGALSGGEPGTGIVLASGSARLHRVFVHEADDVAIEITGGQHTISELITYSTGMRTLEGRGLVMRGGSLELMLAAILSTTDISIDIEHASLVARNLVAGIRPFIVLSGVGVRIADTSDVLLENFYLTSSGLCGLRIEEGGEPIFRDGVIQRFQRGACVHASVFDPAVLTYSVTYLENGASLWVYE